MGPGRGSTTTTGATTRRRSSRTRRSRSPIRNSKQVVNKVIVDCEVVQSILTNNGDSGFFSTLQRDPSGWLIGWVESRMYHHLRQ